MIKKNAQIYFDICCTSTVEPHDLNFKKERRKERKEKRKKERNGVGRFKSI